jgi:hypothetical protein
MSHAKVDARSLAMHRAIADKLRAHPELIGIARENLERWSGAPGRSGRVLDQWGEVLARPLPEVLELIVEESDWMTAMRQTSPFAGVLDPRERWAIYDEFAERR